MTPTREETLQAERDAATGVLADAVRKARDVALEDAASAMGDDRTLLYGDEAARRIRALTSKP